MIPKNTKKKIEIFHQKPKKNSRKSSFSKLKMTEEQCIKNSVFQTHEREKNEVFGDRYVDLMYSNYFGYLFIQRQSLQRIEQLFRIKI